MARAILSSLASRIHALLSSQSPLPLCSSEMLEDLNNLEEFLVNSDVQDVLVQAEERQWLDEQVWNLLTELMDAAHDAEDAVDELHYELLRSGSDDTAPPASITSMGTEEEVCNLFASLACRIEDIIDGLDQIVGEVDSLQLISCQPNSCPEHTTFYSDPTANETDIYGREDDLKNLVDLVLSESPEKVIAVVGEAGVGKTALLRLLCNDSRICEQNYSGKWVRMTEDLDAVAFFRETLESVTASPWRHNISRRRIYQDIINDEDDFYWVRGEDCLLVLDDFSDANLHLLETISDILDIISSRSKIVLVTRSQSIVNTAKNLPVYHANRLSEDSCWKLFQSLAYNSQKSTQSNLIVVGKKIVQKCNGLPLSVKMLGTLLQCETREERWNAVLNHSLWSVDESKHTSFPAAGILSYHYLPPQLQSCIAYCSAFHKSFLFRKSQLVRLWMAQGILGHGIGETLEITGSQLFDELVRRSFFIFCEKVVKFGVLTSDVGEETYIMNHMMHDLVKCISRKSCSTEDIEKIQSIPEEVRHLSLIAMETEIDAKLELEGEAKSLYSMLLIIKSLNSPYLSYNESRLKLSFSPHIFGKFNCLRTLHLSSIEIEELPDSIGDLKHLRYLALNNTGIRWLPQQLGSLYHLQTLELQECRYLVALPSGIANLPNLRHVDLANASEHILLHRGIGKLSGLQTLSMFYVGRRKEHYVIRELGNLVNLRGELHMLGLHNVEDIGDAESANLMNKEFLEKITLHWCEPNDDCSRNGSLSSYIDSHCRHDGAESSVTAEFSEDDDQVELAETETASVVDSFLQDRSGGEDVNDMMVSNDEAFTKMEAEEIERTSPLQKNITSDDYVSWFSDLDFDGGPPKPELTMEERTQRVAKARLLQEGVLEALRPHVNLKDLVIRFYSGTKLSSWLGDPSFHNISSVTLQKCFNCEVLPPFGQLPSLKHLSIRELTRMKYVGREFCGGCSEPFVAFPSLETLQFEGMCAWVEWSGVADGDFPLLGSLTLESCRRLKVVPKFLRVFGKRTYLRHEFLGQGISTSNSHDMEENFSRKSCDLF